MANLGIKYSITGNLRRTSLWNHPASFLAIVNNVTMNPVPLPIQYTDLIYFGYIDVASFLLHIGTLSTHVVILKNMVVLFSRFCRTLHSAFHETWTNVHSHPQWIKIPLTLHPFQYLFSFNLMLATLRGRVNLVMVLMYISMNISNTEALLQIPIEQWIFLLVNFNWFSLRLSCMSSVHILHVTHTPSRSPMVW